MIREKAENLYRKVNTFILTCVGADGYPLTKAVSPGKYRESLKELYFCTNTSSKFVAEISKNTKASVYFYSRTRLPELPFDTRIFRGNSSGIPYKGSSPGGMRS